MSGEQDSDTLHIYFDMDGVLADFDRGVRELCHMEPIVQGCTTSSGRRSATTEAERRRGPKNDDRLWAAVREVPHFYDRLEPVKGSAELFREVHDRYGNNCQILTGIPKPRRGIVTAAEDKINWVHRILSPYVKVNVVYREQKPEFCKGSGSVLIDDYRKNILEWEQYEGTGILFVSAGETINEMRQIGIL